MTILFWLLMALLAVYGIGFIVTFVVLMATKDNNGPWITVDKFLAALLFSFLWPLFWW